MAPSSVADDAPPSTGPGATVEVHVHTPTAEIKVSLATMAIKQEQQEHSADPPSKPGPPLCAVCNAELGKYKCPRCRQPYCSVACNRIHKENHPAMPEPGPSAQQPPTSQLQPSSKGEAPSPYDVLFDHRADITRLFKKYPHLQSQLSKIHQTTLPPDDDTGGGGGGFLPSKQHVLNNLGAKKQPMWSRDVGLRQGAAALRRARTDPGDTGDGVREFCDLVLYLLSKNESSAPGGKGAKDATALVREEVVAEETRIIGRLLEEESEERDR
ncbi:hypothetical protein QBC47DRAFT_409408 [Echria macrotheca]|uniref:HIT-type domain-containing protein n=1 Tax=Echria macrotheca TaxID=438768 RepID=A0AAJ0BQQ2_9PEZI|nr:hypothetical protein QBC47DRAFT_409408 [Echria macrotheca]